MADRGTFVPVYEENENVIRDRILANAALAAWRKEPGDFIYDAIAPVPAEIKQLQANQDNILKNAFAQYAEDQYLDDLLAEVGLTRMKASANKRTLNVTADAGVNVAAGQTVSAVILDTQGNPLQWTVAAAVNFAAAGTLVVAITCKTLGAIANLATGSQFMLLPTIPGVRTIVDAGTTTAGADVETNQAAWERYDFRVKNPDTGGNKNDYVRWAGEVTGVGKAKTIPRWNGNGTVKVVIVGADYTPATPTIVSNAQDYLDPGVTGLGNGKAPCGAAVTVAAATNLVINIVATVTYTVGADLAAVKTAFQNSVKDYLKGLVFINPQDPVVVARIGSLLINTVGVSNYTGLTLNGGTVDIAIGAEQVPTLGAVTI